MKLEIDAKDLKLLSHTSCQSFLQEQRYRFEETTYKGEQFKNCTDDKTLKFTDTYLEALIIYQFWNRFYKCAILWDMDDDWHWVVWIDYDWNDYMNNNGIPKKGENDA